jgi:hypothetical protein
MPDRHGGLLIAERLCVEGWLWRGDACAWISALW